MEIATAGDGETNTMGTASNAATVTIDARGKQDSMPSPDLATTANFATASPSPIRKAFDSDIRAEEGERAIVFKISTGAIDRDGEVLLPKGVDLADYKKNPIVLWAHDYASPPIARAAWIRYDKAADAVIAKAIFADTPFAEDIFKLYQGGFLKASSVGFSPMNSEAGPPTEKEIKANPAWANVRRVWRKWSLLEFSAVPVPSNPEALAVAVSKGVVCAATAKALGVEPDPAATGEPDSPTEESADPAKAPRRRILLPHEAAREAPATRAVFRREVKMRRKNLPSGEVVQEYISECIAILRGRC